MRRVLLLLSLFCMTGCYSYPDYGYDRPQYPPANPAYYAPGNAPSASQNYAPSQQQNDWPGSASLAPYSEQPTNLAPPQSHSLAPQVENQPPYAPPPDDQGQVQDYGSTQPGSASPPAYCDTPENPIACN
jgi:hypothetical protein